MNPALLSGALFLVLICEATSVKVSKGSSLKIFFEGDDQEPLLPRPTFPTNKVATFIPPSNRRKPSFVTRSPIISKPPQRTPTSQPTTTTQRRVTPAPSLSPTIKTPILRTASPSRRITVPSRSTPYSSPSTTPTELDDEHFVDGSFYIPFKNKRTRKEKKI